MTMVKRKSVFLLALLFILAIFTGCSSEEGKASKSKAKSGDKIDLVWYPNESGSDLKGSRDEIGKLIEDATGKKVAHHLTTDYAIAIETLANNKGAMAYVGAQGYIEMNKKNPAIQPLVVTSGASGTLDDAMYHSWFVVKKEDQDQYKENDKYNLDKIAGKKISFVSTSSTSGFKVPTTTILDHFSKQDKYKDLKSEDLMQANDLFPQVLFGDSHQGSAVNLLSGKAEVAAFCDSCVANYVEVADGEENTEGAVYKVKKDAAEPFNTVLGKEFTLIGVSPVLNAPFVVNKDVMDEADIKKLQDAFTSDDVASNEGIFVPKDSGKSGLFSKTEKERFVEVEDKWFDPIRELSK